MVKYFLLINLINGNHRSQWPKNSAQCIAVDACRGRNLGLSYVGIADDVGTETKRQKQDSLWRDLRTVEQGAGQYAKFARTGPANPTRQFIAWLSKGTGAGAVTLGTRDAVWPTDPAQVQGG